MGVETTTIQCARTCREILISTQADAAVDQCIRREMNTGWDFFDAQGNQGHMYAYFPSRLDLVLFYPSQVVRYSLSRRPSFLR